jgi:hypothetical protein
MRGAWVGGALVALFWGNLAFAADWTPCVRGGQCRDLTVGTGTATRVGFLARARVNIWLYDPNAPDFKGSPLSGTPATKDRGYQLIPMQGTSAVSAISGSTIGMRVGGRRQVVLKDRGLVLDLELHDVASNQAELQRGGSFDFVRAPELMAGSGAAGGGAATGGAARPGGTPASTGNPNDRVTVMTVNGHVLMNADRASMQRMDQSAGAILQILGNVKKPADAAPHPAPPSGSP